MKKIMILLAASLLLTSNASGQEKKLLPEQASDVAKELKLLKEKKFNKKIKKFKGNVVVTEDEILFLDDTGSVKKRKYKEPHTRVNISKNGKIVGKQTFSGVGIKGASGAKFEMLDENGEILWQSDKIMGEINVSPVNGGSLVVRQCSEGGCTNKLIFYNKDNLQGKVVTPTSKMQSDGLVIAADGNFIISTFTEGSIPYEMAFFEISGKELWNKRFEQEAVTAIGISKNGDFIAAITKSLKNRDTYLNLYNKQGYLVLKEKVEFGGYKFLFSTDERYLVSICSKGSVYYYDLANKELLWKYSHAEKNIRFLDADFQGDLIAVSASKVNPKDYYDKALPRLLYVFKTNGKLYAKKKITNHGFGLWKQVPEVMIDESKIIINIGSKLIEYQ